MTVPSSTPQLMKQRRNPFHVMCIGLGIFTVLPVVIPSMLCLSPCLKGPMKRHWGIDDYWLVVVGQTILCIKEAPEKL